MFCEFRKIKRTGFFPVWLAGALLSGGFPLLNMAFRAENYTGLPGSGISILLKANWQTSAMMNLMLLILGACILYHIEFADNGLQKMLTLPLRESRIFLGKFLLMILAWLTALAEECLLYGFCCVRWFPGEPFLPELLRSFGWFFLTGLPTLGFMLLISSLCRNMWVPLGAGVVLVFAATLVPETSSALSRLPFVLPYRLPETAGTGDVWLSPAAVFAELVLCILLQRILTLFRRSAL